MEAEAVRVLAVVSELRGAEAWSLALALILGGGGGEVLAFRQRWPQVWRSVGTCWGGTASPARYSGNLLGRRRIGKEEASVMV